MRSSSAGRWLLACQSSRAHDARARCRPTTQGHDAVVQLGAEAPHDAAHRRTGSGRSLFKNKEVQ
jgi:hypothetical protein